ncbi:hypothetical protein ACFL4Z_03410, partial [candidate division KSB1 bacterium]
LKGEHHHKDNPKVPGFELHEIKLIDISYCPICQIFDNTRFILLSQPINFYYNLNSSVDNFQKSQYILPSIYNLPLLRAPPIA